MIIVGLGNPGTKYARTRHNVGFMIVDALVTMMNGTAWKKERDVAWSSIGSHLVIKPQTYMNMSGPALQNFLAYKHLPSQPEQLAEGQLIVVHDELDFPIPSFKIQSDRSSAGHNGVQSIIESLGGFQGFDRLRFGIGDNREHQLPSETYVLQPFTPAEWERIEPAIDQAAELLKSKLQ